MPERMRLSRDGAQLFVALLAREHSPFWWENEQEGYVARFDLDTQEKDHQFWIPLDPFDLVPTSAGELIVTSGSGQHTLFAAFDVDSSERRAEFGSISDGSTLALHPSEERFYTADGPSIPQDLRRWELLAGGGVELAWDSISPTGITRWEMASG